ncbi:AAA family ATPase [Nocardia yamanashiensis]|uniref:AAA family ATPase n=1 Tax=Nocardia yamanashiensis TaxID=209247 RepID=UPI001E511EAC|nr:AAA family ATPase [Nocardia yamanashiensis]UGT45962.1 AAA family ATPase [Nocardia yamanashiensis]
MVPELALTARLNTSAADARRGLVRLHPEALTALGLREWDGITLIGGRRTAAVVAKAPAGTPAGVALLDDVTLSNAGVKEDGSVVVSPATVYGARRISVTGSAMATGTIPEATLRQALLGKVVTVGDTVSLLPRDLGPGTSTSAATQALSRTFGIAWTSELLTVTSTDPTPGPVSVQPNTAVAWGPGVVGTDRPRSMFGDGIGTSTGAARADRPAFGGGIGRQGLPADSTSPGRRPSGADLGSSGPGSGEKGPSGMGPDGTGPGGSGSGGTGPGEAGSVRTGPGGPGSGGTGAGGFGGTGPGVPGSGGTGAGEFPGSERIPGADGSAAGGGAWNTGVLSPTPMSAVAVADLAGVQAQAAKLTEWLNLALNEPELLKALGAPSHLGVLITGPAGVGKATLARAVAGSRRVVELDGPTVGATEGGTRLREVNMAVSDICSGAGGVLLINDIDALLPAEAEPVATLILDQLRAAVAAPAVAVLATTSNPAAVDPRLRAPDLCDREVSLPLPNAGVRAALLEQLVRRAPAEALKLDEIAARTPGFVVSDLAALVREAALRAASRASREHAEPMLRQEDLVGALEVIRPLSRSGSEELAIGSLTLDDVGDMAETKQALTEAVLWPLRHPDSFARLGIEPPRGVLLYGPPGCGKTFLVRALAGTGQLSVHAVKGAELMDKWVGSSERAVRELFQRARDSAPSLVFLDEIDALAPRRGQSTDSGVTDRVVAALLTELDGVEPLRDVVVVGATNRPDLIDPALTRPGRLERLVFVPPPDAAARAEILRTAAKSVPLARGVNLKKLAAELDGYSAADCAALLREAALTAMRRNVDAATVTAADMTAARSAVRPSLDPDQVESLRKFAAQRSAAG